MTQSRRADAGAAPAGARSSASALASELLAGLAEQNVAALARAISLIENGREGAEALLSAVHPKVGGAHRIGITGPPGAGKSTLVERLVLAYRQRGLTVAVVAVDPTSPFSGGALLGDRIRMEAASQDPGVFIRSMATRGAMGGVALTTREVCDLLDAYGFQRILIETVGVGQSELAIASSADTAVLVLVPESGDGVQVLKAGVMEIADVFVVNKADRPGADRLKQEVEVMLGLRRGNAFRHVAPHHHGPSSLAPRSNSGRGARAAAQQGPAEPGQAVPAWEPPVLLAAATKDQGTGEVLEAIEGHWAYLGASGELQRRRRDRLERLTRELVERRLQRLVWQSRAAEEQLAARLQQVMEGRASPYQVAEEIVAGIAAGGQR